LNKAKRCKKGINGKEPVLNLKASDIANLKEITTKKAVNTAFIMLLSIPLMVLRDKYGYGKKRLEKFLNYVWELYDSFEKGYVTLDDLINVLKEEVEVEIKFDKL
jgi:hypothetical protein